MREPMETLFTRHRDDLYTLCRRFAANRADADDLFQDTWVRAWRNYHRYDPGQRFFPWLVTVCVNLHRDRGRRRRRWLRRCVEFFSRERMELELERVESGTPDADDCLARREEKAMLTKCLDGLDAQFRIPLVLHYYFDWSLEAIAEVLDVPPGTVKSRMWTGRRRLAEAMQEAGHE